MAREYTKRRWLIMQASMWVVLALAIGAAAALDHARDRTNTIALGPVQNFGPVRIRFPAGWTVQNGSEFDPLVAAVAREPSAESGGGRRIILYREHLRRDIAPDLYLIRTPIRQDVFGGVDVDTSQTTFGGNPAVLLSQTMVREGEQATEIDGEMVLCAIFPGHEAVTLRLSRNADVDGGDENVLARVAQSVGVDGGQ